MITRGTCTRHTRSYAEIARSTYPHTLTLTASGPASKSGAWPKGMIEHPSGRQLGLAFVEPSYASALLKRLVFLNLQSLSLNIGPKDYSFLEQLASSVPNRPLHYTKTSSISSFPAYSVLTRRWASSIMRF